MPTGRSDLLNRMRDRAREIFLAGVNRVNPYEAVKQFVQMKGNHLILGQEGDSRVILKVTDFDRIFLVGGGKASAPMARAMGKDLPPRVVILSGGTDGNDGPTPAAGAIVDPLTVARGEETGMNALNYLENNDAYHFFERTGERLITGPTNTNVMDVRIILVK